jgi:Spy/CpxP family protein refolding chaperone
MEHIMRKTFRGAAWLGALAAAAGVLPAQEPAAPRTPAPDAPAPESRMRRPVPGRAPGSAVRMFNPTMLLERRDMLNLTADQVTRLSTLESELRAAHEKSEADARPHREQLESLLRQAAPDVGQVRTHAQAVMNAQQAAQLAGLTAAVQARAALTAEQRGRVQGWADNRRFGMRGRVMPRRPARPRPGAAPFRRGAAQQM